MHDQEGALVLGDQVVVMHAGRIVQAGPAREVHDPPATRLDRNQIREVA